MRIAVAPGGNVLLLAAEPALGRLPAMSDAALFCAAGATNAARPGLPGPNRRLAHGWPR
jgi:hypothetical protein